jgi:hypothetical protein
MTEKKTILPELGLFATQRVAVRICLFIFAVCYTGGVHGQPLFGNEWIRPNQKYYRIPIAQTGFYRLTAKELALAGVPVDSVPIQNIRIFRRGRELPTEIESSSGTREEAITSLSFYAQKNDGFSDSALYVTAAAQPHRHYSLYSDTASYFLTWHSDSLAKPMSTARAWGEGGPIYCHLDKTQELFTSFYAPGNFYPPGSTFDNGIWLSNYDVGEGWTGPEIKSGQKFTFSLQTKDLTDEFFSDAGIEMVLVGRSAGSHEVQIIANDASPNSRRLATVDIVNYDPNTLRIPLPVGDVGSDGKMTLTVKVDKGSCSLSAIQWQYPQKNTSSSLPQFSFAFSSSMAGKSWSYRHLPKTRLYHCADLYHVTRILTDSDSTLGLKNISRLFAVKEYLKVPALIPVNFSHFVPTNTEFLIISHPILRQSVENASDPVAEYAAYRSSKNGGRFRTSVVNIQEVNDRFNYGDRGPAGISNLLRWMSSHGHLQFAFLIGRSVDPQSVRKSNFPGNKDMIPNAGWPGSDIVLATNPGTYPNSFIPVVPVGRISASTPQQVWTYLQKVKAFESSSTSARWRKNVLHLSGGRSTSELGIFKGYVQSYTQKLKDSGLAITTVSKKTDDAVEQFPLDTYLNNGIGLMTLFGHSGVNVTDLDIGYASDPMRNYANKPFFPAVIVNGCATGSIFYTPNTISEDWIFAPSAGSVLFLAHTSNGISDALHRYTSAFYETLADTAFMSEPFGVIQKEAIRRNMQRTSLISDFSTSQQMTLHGDPAIRIFPAKYPDYAFDSTQFDVSDHSGRPLTSTSDTLKIRIGIFNNGRVQNDNYQLSFKRTYATGEWDEKQFTFPAVSDADTITLFVPRNKAMGEQTWKFAIDPENLIQEENEANNELVKVPEWPPHGASPLLPIDGFRTNEKKIELVATVPADEPNKKVVFEWDSTSQFRSPQKRVAEAQGQFARLPIENLISIPHITFWRVYLSGDSTSLSPIRKIHFSPDTPTASLPEAVAIHGMQGPISIQEGDVFKLKADFFNAAAVPFSDSIQIGIAHSNQFKSATTFVKIPPLDALEKRSISLDLPSLGRKGLNTIHLTFNTGYLPEEIYTNNKLDYSYTVAPDVIRPLLSVRVDKRLLTDNENVSPRPILNIGVADENPFLVREDTVGIEIKIKEDCIPCIEQRISLQKAIISRKPPNAFFIEAAPERPLSPGRYVLTVKARDLSGNMAVPYTVGFMISDSLKIMQAGVSPIPAHQWFRFYLDLQGQPAPSLWKVVVRNISGKIIYETTTSTHPGRNELIWQPQHALPGLLLYKMELTGQGNIPYQHTGNGLTGKMLWLP